MASDHAMKFPHIITSLTLLLFLSFLLQSHQNSIEPYQQSTNLHRVTMTSPPRVHQSSTSHRQTRIAGHPTAVPSPTGRSRLPFRARRPWQKEKMYGANEHEVPSGPNPISNR
ncbi:PREDICTED: CLAVATA3/ESR (CLE)-related protein 42 [Tarenaya hassleriana]|uniref:CLAVATA3/ESR (CLE)-related protein 42 n=1 Tax=Tarenaya hassleriana TaxID=28532 RepID=UPI0008FD7D92|nr:PREDICTED: CLAVATA3/ESR (CLE)-related protein 42 [Tarenaya hassleriana]